MKLAETVTFGGGGLNRAAERRGDKDALAVALNGGAAQVIVTWRGKVLLAGDARDTVCRVAPGDPVLAEAGTGDNWIFLGEVQNTPIFAADISSWVPDDLDAEAMARFFDPTEYTHPHGPEGSAFAELRGVMTRISAEDAELVITAKALMNWHRSHKFCARCGEKSDMSMAGWQRSCPACGGQHFPRTDPVVIMLVTRGNKVLMGRSPGWPEGMYSLLAGFVEPGETLEAAVRREVAEETAIKVGEVGYLASQPWPFPNSLMFGCYGEALSDEITIDPVEIEDAQWFTREEIAEAFAGRHPLLKPARKGAIAHFLLWNWLADRLD